MSVYIDLLSHFLPFKIHLTNISPILIKLVDFKNLAWATSFATRASRKFIYRASGKKKLLSYPGLVIIPCGFIHWLWKSQHGKETLALCESNANRLSCNHKASVDVESCADDTCLLGREGRRQLSTVRADD